MLNIDQPLWFLLFVNNLLSRIVVQVTSSTHSTMVQVTNWSNYANVLPETKK